METNNYREAATEIANHLVGEEVITELAHRDVVDFIEHYLSYNKLSVGTSKLWVVTECVNDYNQYGEYFKSVFKTKPNLTQLSQLIYEKPLEQLTEAEILYTVSLFNGGGRRGNESSWFYLREVTEAEFYKTIDF